MDSENTLAQMQQQMSSIQEQMSQITQENQQLKNQVSQANQEVKRANQTKAIMNQDGLYVELLKTGNPETFTGENVRSWLKSLDTVISSQSNLPNNINRTKYAVSYMEGAGLQWWELVTLNTTQIQIYADFQGDILSYIEHVNRELSTREALKNI